ncbi:MAG: hypothetical protein RBQ97_11740 [Acholeplasma sp.]|nr:hypothetical protein [Acholeplasma sp.]
MVIDKFKFIIPRGEAEKILSELSFNITKDFRECKLDEIKLRNLILEDGIDKHSNMIGDLLYGTDEVGIRKIRLSKGNNKGKRGGFRLILLVVSIKHTAFVIHIYDKKKKSELTLQEHNNLKKVLKSFNK